MSSDSTETQQLINVSTCQYNKQNWYSHVGSSLISWLVSCLSKIATAITIAKVNVMEHSKNAKRIHKAYVTGHRTALVCCSLSDSQSYWL